MKRVSDLTSTYVELNLSQSPVDYTGFHHALDLISGHGLQDINTCRFKKGIARSTMIHVITQFLLTSHNYFFHTVHRYERSSRFLLQSHPHPHPNSQPHSP